ncbi:MAG: acetyl-CoA carboxylase, carboxyltransferase subunit beta [Marivibrio sp.]|uniref:acetyl-CoA carboxylase, carboxyltransferase subunit beta n=1 Tax=Marivibrio sp. TaxID=2039719 RepID=UPI0032EEFA6A
MNWIANFVRPRIKALVGQPDVPDNLWTKCTSCGQMMFHRDLNEHNHVCQHCGHHMHLPVDKRLALLFDEGYETIDLPKVKADPLRFRDHKRYGDRLKDAQSKTGRQDAIVVAHGRMGGQRAVVAAFDFKFMGGSMGMAVGEGLIAAARLAVMQQAPLIAIPASGGARMQEGILSLMQMPRTTVAVDEVKEAGLPFIVLLTDPTTGGVSASFAMLGDIHIAEPGAMIGFAGRRVIEQTVRETLPEKFQTSEYLLDHGMVDMVVPRAKLRETLVGLIDLLMHRNAPEVNRGALPLAASETIDIPDPATERSGEAGETKG